MAVQEEAQVVDKDEVVEDEAIAEPEIDNEIEDKEDDEPEALNDGIEGSVRLKRLLTRDDDEDAVAAKKRRMSTPHGQKTEALLLKWALQDDLITRHVLEQLPIEELEGIEKSNYSPDKWNEYKTPGDLLARYACEMRERSMAGGGALDSVSLFTYKWKIPLAEAKEIRELCHKDLRYLYKTYDGTKPLKEVIAEAAETEPADDNTTVDCLPTEKGVSTFGRFNRLELVDPLTDCAVFGDANLTFALKLAKHRKALGHVGRVIATTFEDYPTLKERYAEIDESISILEDHYAEVYHEVDCTKIGTNPKFHGLEGSLGGVYYNFPHSGAIGGFFDGHPVVNWRHENLMRLFFRALRSFVRPGGIVKVSSNMGAVGVRFSYIVGGALENEFVHEETVKFTEWTLHRYGRSYGDRRDAYKRPDAKNNESYNAQKGDSDMLYCFRYWPSGKKLEEQMVRLPPTLKTIMACTDGPFKHLVGESKKNLANQLHKRFITEISGVHVG